jgi:hypothetical protein
MPIEANSPTTGDDPAATADKGNRILVSAEAWSELKRLKSVIGVRTYDEVILHLVRSQNLGFSEGKGDVAYLLSRLEKGEQILSSLGKEILTALLNLERGTLHAQAQLCGVLAKEIETFRKGLVSR